VADRIWRSRDGRFEIRYDQWGPGGITFEYEEGDTWEVVELSTGRVLARLEGDRSPVYGNRRVKQVDFSEDGRAVVAQHYDGRTERIELDPQS